MNCPYTNIPVKKFKNYCVVLVEPKRAGNVGACARAMMNFGFSDLRLVKPLADLKSRECLDRAMTAGKIVKGAKIFGSMKEAVADCRCVIGTSARRRRLRLNWMTLRDFADVGAGFKPAPTNRAALVFGPEDRGLSNADLLLCDRVVTIPMAGKFPSLNLSHAVAVVLYELFMSWVGAGFKPAPTRRITSSKKREAFYDHLQKALLAIGFLNPANPNIAMQEIRNIFARAGLDAREVNILRGLCRRILNKSPRALRSQTVAEKKTFRFLEGLRGGPLTFGGMIESFRKCDELTQAPLRIISARRGSK